MDVETAITFATAAAGGAATAAGQSAWQALVTLGRHVTGAAPGEGPGGAPAVVDPEDGAAVGALTGRIAECARTDDDFAAELCDWAETHSAAINIDQRRVTNHIGGNASVGKAIQVSGDINGNITL